MIWYIYKYFNLHIYYNFKFYFILIYIKLRMDNKLILKGKINDNERYHYKFVGCNIDCPTFLKLKAHYKANPKYKGNGQKKRHDNCMIKFQYFALNIIN